ncbi:hypothetical protein HaLaN_11248, partial [Haematococcus lacustris]
QTLACSAQTILSSDAILEAPPASSQIPASAWQSVSAIASTLPHINAVYVVGYTDLATAGSLPSALASLISPGQALRDELQEAGITAKVAVAVSPCASSLAMGLAIQVRPSACILCMYPTQLLTLVPLVPTAQGAPNLAVSFPDPWRGVQTLTWDPTVPTATATFLPTPPPAELTGIMLASPVLSSTISSSQSRVANTSSLVSTVSALVSGSVAGLAAHGVTVTGPVRLYSGVSPNQLPTLLFAVRASAPVFKVWQNVQQKAEVKLFDNVELDLAGLAAAGSQPLVMVQSPGASVFHTRTDLLGTATWAAIAQSMPTMLRTAIAPLVASSSRLSFRLQAVNDDTLATIVITINPTSTPLQLGSLLSTNVPSVLAAHGVMQSAGDPVVLTMSAMATGAVTLASLRVGDTSEGAVQFPRVAHVHLSIMYPLHLLAPYDFSSPSRLSCLAAVLTHCNPSVPCSAPSACLPALNICYPNTAPRLMGVSCNVTGQACLQPFRCLQGQQVRVLDLSLLDPYVPAAAPVCVECFQDSHCASRRGSNGLPMICNTGTRAEQAVLRSTLDSANAWGFPTLTQQFYRCIDKPRDVTLDAESACPTSGIQCITNNMRLPSPATFGIFDGKIGGMNLWDIMRIDTLLRASLMYYTNGRSLACPLPIFRASEVGDRGTASVGRAATLRQCYGWGRHAPPACHGRQLPASGFGPTNYRVLSQVPELRDFLYVATQLVPALSGGKIPALQMALAVNPCNPVYVAMAFNGLQWAPELPRVQGGQFVGSVGLRSVQVAPGGNIPFTTSWKTWDKNDAAAMRTIGNPLEMSANFLAQVEGSFGFSVGKAPDHSNEQQTEAWAIVLVLVDKPKPALICCPPKYLQAEGVASLVVYSMAYKRIAFDLVVLPKIEIFNAIIEFDLGKLATGSLGLVITERQVFFGQLDIQLGAGLVVNPASVLQEYIKSNWIRKALTTIFPFLESRLEMSLNFAIDREGFGARYIMTLRFNSPSGGSLMGYSAVRVAGHSSGEPDPPHTASQPITATHPAQAMSVPMSQEGGCSWGPQVLSCHCCNSVLEPSAYECCVACGAHALILHVSTQAAQRDIQFLWVAVGQQFLFVGYLLHGWQRLYIRAVRVGHLRPVDRLSERTICDGWIKDDRCYYSDDRYDTVWSCGSGYIGVSILTCIRPRPSRVVRKFGISRYDASCRLFPMTVDSMQIVPHAGWQVTPIGAVLGDLSPRVGVCSQLLRIHMLALTCRAASIATPLHAQLQP